MEKFDDLKRMVEICELYYEKNIKQEDIAHQMGLSRPKVCRILAKAREMGVVKVTILNPFETVEGKEVLLKQKYGLKECRIVVCDNQSDMKRQIGKAGADLLKKILKPHDIIGISWGTTLSYMADELEDVNIEGLEVVQLKGVTTKREAAGITYGVAERMAKALHADLVYRPVPVMVESADVCKHFLEEPSIKQAVEIGKKANIAVFSIGYPSENSVITQYGYIEKEVLQKMREEGVAGDIFSRFFKIDGSYQDIDLNCRNTSLSLEDLRKKEYAIGMIGGKYAYRGLLGALHGAYLNCIVTDEDTADKLIACQE